MVKASILLLSAYVSAMHRSELLAKLSSNQANSFCSNSETDRNESVYLMGEPAGVASPTSTPASPSRSRAWRRPRRRRPPRRSPSRRTRSTSAAVCWRRGTGGARPAARWPRPTSRRSSPPTTPSWRRTTRRARTTRTRSKAAAAAG